MRMVTAVLIASLATAVWAEPQRPAANGAGPAAFDYETARRQKLASAAKRGLPNS